MQMFFFRDCNILKQTNLPNLHRGEFGEDIPLKTVHLLLNCNIRVATFSTGLNIYWLLLI